MSRLLCPEWRSTGFAGHLGPALVKAYPISWPTRLRGALDMYNVVYHLGPAQLKGHSISGLSLAEGALDISWCKASKPSLIKAYPISGPSLPEGALDISCCKASGPSLIKGISYIWADPR